MNHVFLSGTVDSAPVLLSLPEQTPHVIMDLIITHRTAAGIEKKERYPISAWHAPSAMDADQKEGKVNVNLERISGGYRLIYSLDSDFLALKPPSVMTMKIAPSP